MITMDIKLPDNLKDNLGRTRRRALQVLLATTVFAAIALFGSSMLLLYISDRFWATPNSVRLLILISTLIVFVLFLVRHFRNRNSLAKDRDSVIKLVQRFFPKLGDSLQGAVELSSGEHKGMSEALCSAAVKQVGQQTEGMDFTEAVSTQRRNKALKYFSIAAVVITLCCLIDYKALLNTAQRWALPLANIDRYTFINIADMKKDVYVEHGKDFELPVSIDENSRFKSSVIKYSFTNESIKEQELDNLKAVLKLKGQTKKTVLHLYAGDSSKELNIIPVLPPAIVKVNYTIHYPEYLNKEAETKELKGTQLEVLKGSKYELSASTSSKLSKSAYTRLELNDQGDETKRLDPVSLKVEGASFATDSLSVGDKLIFQWWDTHGFKNRKDREIAIDFVADNPPFADIPNINKNNYILVDKNVPVNINCMDDYGLKNIGIEYCIEKDGEKGKWIHKSIRSGKSDSSSLTALYILNGEKMQAEEGSTIYIRSYALDFFPERKPVYSAEYSFSIISKEEHAQMVKDKLNEITSKIDDAIVREEQNKNKNTVLSQLDEENINSESTDSAIDSQTNNELANAQDLKDLADEAQEALKMANDNSLFDKEELDKLKKNMEQVKDVAENLMQDAAQDLEDAAESQGTSEPQDGKPQDGKPQDGKPQDGQPQDGQPQDGQPQDGKPQDGKPQDGKPQDGKPQDGKPQDGKPQDGQPQDGQPQDGQPQDGQPQDGESRQDKLEDAVAKQEEILEKLKEANEAAQEANRNSELKIMAARLKALAEIEKNVSANVGEVFKMVPGQSTDKLKKIIASMLKGITANQEQVKTEIASLKKEIYKFFDATKFEEYGKVHTDMETVQVNPGMDKLIAHLQKNHAFSSHVQAEMWAEKLLEWAKWLEGDEDEQESEDQEPQEGEPQEQEVDEFLMALLDIIINEQILREDTIERYKNKSLKNYEAKTEELAETQSKIGKSLAEIVNDAPDEDIKKLLFLGGKFMLEVKELLLKHDAGQETVNSESAAIEILAKAFEAAAPQSSDQQGMMSMLGAAMGMGQGQGPPGSQPMGNMAGPNRAVSDNFTATLNKNIKGNPNETKHNEREADKFVGDSLEGVPQEYRKLMEEYYKRVEKKYEK